MSSETGYQGWANYETWATALWIDNDQGLYLTARTAADEQRSNAADDENVANGIWTEEETARYRLADELKEWTVETLLPDLGASLAADLLGAAVSKIDWSEIADHYLDR